MGSSNFIVDTKYETLYPHLANLISRESRDRMYVFYIYTTSGLITNSGCINYNKMLITTGINFIIYTVLEELAWYPKQ